MLAGLVVFATALLVAGPAAADDRPTSTVQKLATTLHDQLGELLATQSRGAMDLAVCVVPPAGSAPDSGAVRLAERVQSILAASSARDGWRSVSPLPASGACDRTAEAARTDGEARGLEVVVHVAAAMREGRFFLEGTVLRTDRSLWREISGGRGGATIGQLFASARLDAELRYFLGITAPPLSKRSVGIWHETPGAILAMAAGDVDGDDVDELVILRRDGVEVLGARAPGPRAALLGHMSLSAIAPAPVASRDPVGTVALLPPTSHGRRIALRTSDQAAGILVGWDGTRFGASEPLALGDGAPGAAAFPIDAANGGMLCAILPPGRNVFEPRTVPCTDTPAPRPATGAGPFWNVSFASILQPSGEAVWSIALATAEPRLITTNAGVTTDLGPSGSAVLSTDLDDDGIVDIARTSTSLPGAPDRIVVTSLTPEGPRDTWTSRPTVGTISAFASGDFDGDGTIELAWAELHRGGARVWIQAVER